MEKILFILAITISSLSFGQGNLQFNQVKFIEYTTTTTAYSTTTAGVITVPAGKVWKVEHANVYMVATYPRTQYGGWSLFIDNTLIYRSKGASNSIHLKDAFPLWLPAGNYNIVVGQETAGSQTVNSSINAIEFNIVP
ncbi:MAG: hypothetical protein P8H56_09345 [Crocinitomicaceae bacterium]|nr:hypothetical protein [Crocinitomicaceae bacterium]